MKGWMDRHKVWTGVLITVGALVVIGALSGTSDTTSSVSSENTSPPVTSLNSGTSDSYAAPEEEESYESSGQENAREQAENYLNSQAFSRKGLIEQLEYEGYSTADATYAVDAIDVNWNEQAVLKAKQYLDTQSFSRSGLQDQLEYEGFTPAQAAHGVRWAY